MYNSDWKIRDFIENCIKVKNLDDIGTYRIMVR